MLSFALTFQILEDAWVLQVVAIVLGDDVLLVLLHLYLLHHLLVLDALLFLFLNVLLLLILIIIF